MMTYSKKRIEALQERLEQEGLDGLLLATGASFAYLLDMASLPFQRTRAELFVYMRMEYTNPPLDTAILLANLQNEHHGKSVVKHKLKIDIKCHFSIHIAFA